MSSNDFYSNVWLMASLCFLSSIAVGVGLITYAVFNDYVFYEIGQVSADLVTQGLMSSLFQNFIEGLQGNILVLIPSTIDWLWALIFVGFVFSFLQSSYLAKRENYFSFLTFTSFTIMIILFGMSLFTTLSTWFNEEIINKLLPNLIYATPFFSLYLDNLALVNIIIIGIAVILNFVDMDLARFKFRKNADVQTSEIN